MDPNRNCQQCSLRCGRMLSWEAYPWPVARGQPSTGQLTRPLCVGADVGAILGWEPGAAVVGGVGVPVLWLGAAGGDTCRRMEGRASGCGAG
eukprot:1100021-Karenia_brevis.AAC.1